jgi:hypothetical protein
MARNLEKLQEIDKFYAALGTVPGLIGELAMSVAAAQARLDRNYVDSFTKFVEVVRKAVNEGVEDGTKDTTLKPDDKTKAKDAAATRLIGLFQAIAPSRYQFTETVLEVRADLQASGTTSLGAGFSVGGPAAVAVNASYTRRNSYDYRAAALIKTTLHAISASDDVLKELLARLEKTPVTELPESREADNLGDAVKELVKAGDPKKDAAVPAEKND